MPQTCASCKHPQVREINRRIKQGRQLVDISRWLSERHDEDPIQYPYAITRQALARHARDHLGADLRRGTPPPSGDFLEDVVANVHTRLVEGTIQPTMGDAIKAKAELNRQQARNQDRDLMAKIALALTGQSPLLTARVIDPEVEAIEAEFRPLLTSG